MIYEILARHWMTIHGLIVTLGLAIYVIASHTLRQRRHPSTAIAWVVALVLFPYIALPLYLMFGSRKLTSYLPEARKFSYSTGSANREMLSTRTQQLAAVMKLPAATNYQQLNIHEDGTSALHALKSMINGAKRSIDVCTFIFSRDRVGEEIATSLIQRAREGVKG